MKYLLLLFGLLLSAQASMATVLYSFSTTPVGKFTPFSFSFEEPQLLASDTLIPDGDLQDVSGLPPGFNLQSIGITFFGPTVTLTENLKDALPISFFFANPWNKPGTFEAFLGVASMTISNDPVAPEPAEFGLVVLGAVLLMWISRKRVGVPSSPFQG